MNTMLKRGLLAAGLLAAAGTTNAASLWAQEPDSLSLEEILRGTRTTGRSGLQPEGDSLLTPSPQLRRLTALQTFRNAAGDFDLDTWLASRRAFLQSVRDRFGLDEGDAIEMDRQGLRGSEAIDSTDRADAPRGGIDQLDRESAGGRTDIPEAEGRPRLAPATTDDMSTLLEGLVAESVEREDLLLDLLVRLDARLERLERVAGTLPDMPSTDELRTYLRERRSGGAGR